MVGSRINSAPLPSSAASTANLSGWTQSDHQPLSDSQIDFGSTGYTDDGVKPLSQMSSAIIKPSGTPPIFFLNSLSASSKASKLQ